ncbi:glycosyltransferase [Pedobacter yonginense]|uniref:glycosyltransferase n=1 Tax=Pedobacter yonginense TaxID=651869 RepID=UPI001F0C300B|nr:glycosyltransferase [Pedobacter yonginense]
MKNRDIIIVGQQAWDTEIGSNCKNIALEFSKTNRVLYVNPPLDRITKFRGKSDPKVQKRLDVISGDQNGLEKIAPNLYNLYPNKLIESINWLPGDFIFDLFNKINNKRFASCIKAAITELGLKDYILFNDSDIFRSFYLKELIHPSLSIYYSRDNMIATEYYRKHGLKLEPKIIAKNDLCTANSEYLKNYCKQFNPNAEYVGQGCDLSIFNDFHDDTETEEFNNIKLPIIGYVGVLTSARLDIDLISHLATNKPEWSIVLVGPEDEAFKNSNLHQLPNVHFLGPKSPEDLPKYVNLFDVCFNPQAINPLTIGNYPRKIDEYLAMGKPTVATRTESMVVFKDYVSLVDDKFEYVPAIEKLLEGNNSDLIEARKRFALSHSWENSVNLIYKAIDQTLKS